MQRANERIMLNITRWERKTAQWIREKSKVRDIMETISKLKWNWAWVMWREEQTNVGQRALRSARPRDKKENKEDQGRDKGTT